jgi:hypothetical protein
MSNIHSVTTTLIDQSPKGVFEKKKCSFSFNGRDAKMYIGPKIYGNTKHGAH